MLWQANSARRAGGDSVVSASGSDWRYQAPSPREQRVAHERPKAFRTACLRAKGPLVRTAAALVTKAVDAQQGVSRAARFTLVGPLTKMTSPSSSSSTVGGRVRATSCCTFHSALVMLSRRLAMPVATEPSTPRWSPTRCRSVRVPEELFVVGLGTTGVAFSMPVELSERFGILFRLFGRGARFSVSVVEVCPARSCHRHPQRRHASQQMPPPAPTMRTLKVLVTLALLLKESVGPDGVVLASSSNEFVVVMRKHANTCCCKEVECKTAKTRISG